MALSRSFIHFHSPLQRINSATLLFPHCLRIPTNPLSSREFFELHFRCPWRIHLKVTEETWEFVSLAPPKRFAASRLDIPDAWQMPQGGIDENEDPRSAVVRELREETGVTSADIVAEVPYWLTYDFPPEVREKLKKQWGSDWKGQAQKWFLLKFTGKEEEINLLGDGTEKAEFGEWSWLSPQQLVDRAVDFKKPVYQEVLTVFSQYL